MKININNRVTVRLTDQGKQILRRHNDELRKLLKDFPEYVTSVDDNKESYQFWELMQIYGNHLYNGCKIPFVDNLIEIEKN